MLRKAAKREAPKIVLSVRSSNGIKHFLEKNLSHTGKRRRHRIPRVNMAMIIPDDQPLVW
jgi:hypothetical protein